MGVISTRERVADGHLRVALMRPILVIHKQNRAHLQGHQ